MDNTINRSCGSGAIKLLLIIVLIALVIWILYPYFTTNVSPEKFKQDIKMIPNNPMAYQQQDITIQPSSYDVDTDIIQSGTGFIPQKNYFTPWGTIIQVKDMVDGSQVLSESAVTDYTMNSNQCSIACCSDQWPVPFKMPVDKTLCESNDEFVPTSYFCNNGWQNSGCLCMTKQQSEFLNARGSNTD